MVGTLIHEHDAILGFLDMLDVVFGELRILIDEDLSGLLIKYVAADCPPDVILEADFCCIDLFHKTEQLENRVI